MTGMNERGSTAPLHQLLFFVPALFIRAKWLRGQNDIRAFKHCTRRLVAKDFNLHLHPCFSSARQTVEIAA